MLKNAIKAHENFHGVTISKEMVEYAILISACFNSSTKNPDRTNDLIDASMVIAKEKGLKEVIRECILENFDINFDKYNKMSIEDRKSVAYHEAGHYLVWRISSDILKDRKGIAVSIMPAEENLGVTVFDDLSDEATVCPNHKYFITTFAGLLAGRISEELFTSDINSGASNDKTIDMINQERKELLKEAADYAKNILNNNKELLEKISWSIIGKGYFR